MILGSTGRAILNWVPLADFVESHNGAVRFGLTFDVSTKDVDLPPLVRERLGFKYEAGQTRQLDRLVHDVRQWQPTALMLATIQSPIEVDLSDALSTERTRPVVIAAQHGFVQRWDRYQRQTCFDFFLTFGPMFTQPMEDDSRFRTGALPKLDLIQPRRRRNKTRTALFAPQTHIDPSIKSFLVHLLETHRVLLKPHPAAPEAYASLVECGLLERCYDRSIDCAMDNVDFVVTTGSTVVLEALTKATPVVVLPFQEGRHFDELGIVLEDYSVERCLKIVDTQEAPQFRDIRHHFLEQATGSSRNRRSRLAYEAVKRMAADFRQNQVRLGSNRILLSHLLEAVDSDFFLESEIATLHEKPMQSKEIIKRAFNRRFSRHREHSQS